MACVNLLIEAMRVLKSRKSDTSGLGIVVEAARVLKGGPKNVNKGRVSVLVWIKGSLINLLRN